MPTIIDNINLQARELGISQPVIARLTGISLPTVKRIMAGRYSGARLADVEAIARVLGLELQSVVRTDADTLRLKRAEQKAAKIAKQVQATSALEAQGVDEATLRGIRNEIVHGLMAGPKSKLWTD